MTPDIQDRIDLAYGRSTRLNGELHRRNDDFRLAAEALVATLTPGHHIPEIRSAAAVLDRAQAAYFNALDAFHAAQVAINEALAARDQEER